MNSGSAAPEDHAPDALLQAPSSGLSMPFQCFKSQHSTVNTSIPVSGEAGPPPPALTPKERLGKHRATHQTLGGQLRQLMHHAVGVIQDRNAAGSKRRRVPTLSKGWQLAPGLPPSRVGEWKQDSALSAPPLLPQRQEDEIPATRELIRSLRGQRPAGHLVKSRNTAFPTAMSLGPEGRFLKAINVPQATSGDSVRPGAHPRCSIKYSWPQARGAGVRADGA